MNYSDFSATADAEETALPCERETIPILPVRFSLLPYDLDKVVKPTSIDNPGSYLVRTLRRGFVYVYVEDPQDGEGAADRKGSRNWHVFRFETNNKDVNGTHVPENTDSYIRADFKFSKYLWSKATADSDWVYDDSVGPSSTIFVPGWASKVWIAYSEYRWPAVFFTACNDPSVRAQLMQPVNLRGPNQWAAKLANADQIVEEFKPEAQRATKQVLTKLELTQVKLASKQAPQRSHERAALVALFDPVGDVKDAQFRIRQMGNYIENLTEAYKYPLTIGNFCMALKSEVDERDGFFDRHVGNRPAFRKGWEDKYLGIKDDILDSQSEIKVIINFINETIADRSPCSIGILIELARNYPDKIDVCAFGSIIFGQSLLVHGTCSYGQDSLEKIILLSGLKEGWKFDKVIDEYNSAAVSGYLNKILSMWSGLEDVALQIVRKYTYSFEVILEAFSSQLQLDDVMNNKHWSGAFNTVYQNKRGERILFKKMRLGYKEAVEFLSGTFSENKIRQLYASLTQSGEIYISAKAATGDLTVDVPAVEIDSKLKMIGGMTAQRGIVSLQGGTGLLEVVSGMWVLAELSKANNAAYELFKEDKTSKFLNDDRLVIASVMASITDALIRVGQAMTLQTAGGNAASAFATKTLFQGKLPNAIFSTLYSPALEASSGVGRAAALWVPRISAGLAAIVAGGAAYRASQTGDKAALIGNAMMAVSSILMVVPGANAVVIVGAVFVYAIGFGISLLSYSLVEDVVRTSFWGSSKEYWGGSRLSIDEQMQKLLNDDGDEYQKYLKTETERFQDLFWGVNVHLINENEKSFKISSPMLAEQPSEDSEYNNVRIFWSLQRFYIDVSFDVDDYKLSGRGADLIELKEGRQRDSINVNVKYSEFYSESEWTILVEVTRKSTGTVFKKFLTPFD